MNAGLLKDIASEIATLCLFVINLSLQTGIQSLNWKLAHVTPLYKKEEVEGERYFYFADVVQQCPFCFIQLILKFVPDEVDGLPDELVIPTSLAAKKNSKF